MEKKEIEKVYLKKINELKKFDKAYFHDDYNDYSLKADVFSSNLNHLSSIRKNLRQKAVRSPVFDAAEFANDFSDMLWEMWRKYNKN